MHQRKRNRHFSRFALSSTPDSAGEGREENPRAGWTAEDRPASSFESWDPADPAIFFDSLDIEGKRIDLPCDDDGQVFLAPHRTFESMSGDGVITPSLDDPQAGAMWAPADAAPVVVPEPSHRSFGFLSDGKREKPIEPMLDLASDLPVQKNVITDVFVSAQTSPILAPEEIETDHDVSQDRWDIDRAPLSDGENILSYRSAAADEAVVNTIARPEQVAVVGPFAAVMSLFGTASRTVRTLAATLGALLRACRATINQALRALVRRAVAIGSALCSRIKTAVATALGLGARIVWRAASGLHAGWTSLFGVIIPMARNLGTRSRTIAAASWSGTSQALRAFMLRLPSVGLAVLNATRKRGSALSSALSLVSKALMTKAAQTRSVIGRRLLGAFAVSSNMFGRAISRASTLGHVTPSRSITATGNFYQSLNDRSGRTLGSMQQMIGRGALRAGKGKSLAKETVQQVLTTARSVFGGMTRISLAGLAGAAACVVLLVTVWSDASTPKLPSIVLAFPPKPLQLPARPLHNDPVTFDRSAIENPSQELEDAASIDDSPVELIAAEDRAFLSPEDALAELVRAVAPVEGVSTSSPPPKPAFETEEPSADLRPRSDVNLAALTLLADIDAIAGLREFARAVRIVGLETLIQPGRPYTMLVPSDEAFAKLGRDRLETLLDPSGHDQLRALLSNHILEERLQFSDFAGEIGSYLSLADQTITIEATGVIKVEEASMIEMDLWAANTVVHVIDDILALREPWNNEPSLSATAIGQASDT